MTQTQPFAGDVAEMLTQRAIELLATLVGFESISRQSNLPLLRFVRNYLHHHHIDCDILPSPDGDKGNLLARIGPRAEGGIVLSGHTDVVPVEGQSWNSNPFVLTARDGRLYGRGTADMKSFLAICLAFAPEFARLPLTKPIYFAFSYDEEVGCLGVPFLLEHIGKYIPKPSFAIIGEPTRMQVVTAHKGVLSYITTVQGAEWHSSQPECGVNAIQAACGLVGYLGDMAAGLAAEGARDERFDPPYTTVHVGIIHGGTARNIIPGECHFNWEIRPLPSDDADAIFDAFDQHCREVEAQLRQRSPKAKIVSRPVSRMTGVTLPAGSERASALAMRCAMSNREHAVSFGTEAGVFNDHGIPAIICGPGDIAQAHQPDEFIAMDQLRAGVEFMLRLCEEKL